MRGRAVVCGMIATFPVGGVFWDYAQYAVGLERLGFEVFYLEDTDLWSYDPPSGEFSQDGTYGARFLEHELTGRMSSMKDRWCFRSADGNTYGLDPGIMETIVADADILLNISGSCMLRPPYLRCRRKVLVDTDPGWNHFVVFPKMEARHRAGGPAGFRDHDHFFTYATKIGKPGCELPTFGLQWHTTWPPVALECWAPEGDANTWTSVLTWDNYSGPVRGNGRTYGSKAQELQQISHLPGRLSVPLEMAMGGVHPPLEVFRNLGWSVRRAEEISRTADDYRRYVEGSRGEFSVAKNIYVATGSGWFSCRSVCYLAAGRPVVLQDTGFSDALPVGEGILAFADLAEATVAVESVEADYAHHQRCARRLAEEYFEAGMTVERMLEAIGFQ